MWYVIYVKGGQEHKTTEFLQNNSLKAFTPMKEKYHKKNGKLIKVQQVLFPNYIFIDSSDDYVDFSSKLNKLKLMNKSLIKELKYDLEGTPALHEEEVMILERLLGVNNVVATSVGFIEDDRVVITEGPLVGFESSIVHIDRHKREAKIEIDILGSKREVKVSLDILSKI